MFISSSFSGDELEVSTNLDINELVHLHPLWILDRDMLVDANGVDPICESRENLRRRSMTPAFPLGGNDLFAEDFYTVWITEALRDRAVVDLTQRVGDDSRKQINKQVFPTMGHHAPRTIQLSS